MMFVWSFFSVDLVVTEIFDAAVFGEHCLSTLSHAWSHLIDTSEDKVCGVATYSVACVWHSHYQTTHFDL